MRPNITPYYSAFAGTVFSFLLVVQSSDAGESAIEALAARDLAPAAEIYAKEELFKWPPGGQTSLAGDGFTVRRPAGGNAKQVLVGGPTNAVIADVALEKGPLAMSPRVAQALGLRPDNAQLLQILSLKQRPRAMGVAVPSLPARPSQQSAA